MKALSIAALLAIVTTSTITPALADDNHCNRFNNGNHKGWYNNWRGNNNWNNGWNGNNWNNGRFNINNRQTQLNSRIQSGITRGRLSNAEAARIQSRYNQIAELEARLRTSGNRLSFGERSRLNSELSRLSARLNRDLRDGNNSRWW